MSQHVSSVQGSSPAGHRSLTRDVYHFAMEYSSRGWATIPLHGKKPALHSWKEYQSRRPSEDELRDWFSDPQADLNIGIVTGISGLVVIDCDTSAAATWWLNNYPPSPLMVETGRGLHIYYQMPADSVVGNHARMMGQPIDLRGHGGYVVAPPSRHPETNRLYTWSSWGDDSLESIPTFDAAWLGRGGNTSRGARSGSEVGSSNAESHVANEQHESRAIIEPIRKLLRCLDARVADRSRRDYLIICRLLRRDVPPDDIWQLVKDKSKFKTHGRRYFDVTMQNAIRDVNRNTGSQCPSE